MTHLSNIPQALKSDERELFSLITTDSSQVPLQDIRTVEILPIQLQETSSVTQIKMQSLSRLVAKAIARAAFLQGFLVFNFLGSDD